VVLACGSTLVLAAGCGEDDVERTALDRYLAAVRPAFESELAALEEATGAFSGAADLAAAAESLEGAAAKLTMAVENIEGAQAPAGLEEANDGLVVYYRQGAEAMDTMASLLASVATAQTEEELQQLQTEWDEAIASAAADNVDTTALMKDWQTSVEDEAERVGLDMPAWYEDLRQAIDAEREKVGSRSTE
jgi:hypothetical protein